MQTGMQYSTSCCKQASWIFHWKQSVSDGLLLRKILQFDINMVILLFPIVCLQIVFPLKVFFCFSIFYYFRIQKSERYLPSFQTVAYAINSITLKYNWTEAIIFAGK